MSAQSLRAAPPELGRTRRGAWVVLDAVVAGVFAVPTAAVLANEARGRWSIVLVPVLLGLVVVPMALRRRWPAPCLAVTVGAVVLLNLVEPRAVVVGLCALGYTLYLSATTAPLWAALTSLVAAELAAAATALPDFTHPFGAGLFGTAYAVVWVVGFGVGMDRRRTADLLLRQAELAAAEIDRAHAVVAQQRLGIARDLHDVVAHGLTTITVQSAYARLSLDDHPDRAAEALAAIETVGRRTLVELRQMLQVLRGPADDHAAPATLSADERTPTPGLADIGALAARAEISGLCLDLDVIASADEIPAGIQAAAYRTVQEALTNVVKHAAAQQVSVTVRQEGNRLMVEIADQGRGCPDEPRLGYGLVGMRERAALYGGTFEAGPGPHGGFRVVSTFPVLEAATLTPTGLSDEPVTL